MLLETSESTHFQRHTAKGVPPTHSQRLGEGTWRALRVSILGQTTAASLLNLTVPSKLSTKVSENRWTDPRNGHRHKPARTENPDVEDA